MTLPGDFSLPARAIGNMMVPVDILEPILEDLLTRGRAQGPVRPWLGMYTTQIGRASCGERVFEAV